MTEIRSAVPALLDLAEAMRPDWDRTELSGALVSAANNGWSWPKTFLATARLLVQADATPRDLLAETASPVAPLGQFVPGLAEARAAEARVLLEEALAAAPRDAA